MRRLLAFLALVLSLLSPVALPIAAPAKTSSPAQQPNPNRIRHAHGEEVSPRRMPVSIDEQDPH